MFTVNYINVVGSVLPMGNKVFIVIPAFNEEATIGSVVQNLRKKGYSSIVVVDDGSSDDTLSVAKNNGARVVAHRLNRGQGAALQTGMDYAVLEGADIIVTFDADGQHDPSEIKEMISPILKGEAEVSLGSRFLSKQSNVPFFKKLVLKGGVLFTYLTTGMLLSDTHNGFRAFSRKAARELRITQDRMEHASEIIEQIRIKHLKHKEVPVTIRYTEYSRKKGQSPLEAARIGVREM